MCPSPRSEQGHHTISTARERWGQNTAYGVTWMNTIEIKAAVPAKDFELSKRFYHIKI
jgi:hypothetical protein